MREGESNPQPPTEQSEKERGAKGAREKDWDWRSDGNSGSRQKQKNEQSSGKEYGSQICDKIGRGIITDIKDEMRGRDRAMERAPETTPRDEREWLRWVQERIRRLPFRLGRGTSPEFSIGTRVLVVKGEARNDLGQMAVVSRRAGSQVEISYRSPVGVWKTRRKQPGSLIRLEEGIEVTVDDEGWPVIRRMRERGDGESASEDLAVVSDDEGLAQ